jgi:hypothetical protein
VVQSVEQIKVDRVGLQAFQLLIEQAVEIGAFFDQPDGRLGRNFHALAVAILQGFAEGDFAHLVVIDIGGVEIIHPRLDGFTNHLGGFFLVNVAAFAVQDG